MIRATTPKHTFIFDVDPEETFSDILITYAQSGKIILEKHKSDLTFENCEDLNGRKKYFAFIKLTQKETNMFHASPKGVVDIQVRAITPTGEALASEIERISVQNVLNDEVLSCE